MFLTSKRFWKWIGYSILALIVLVMAAYAGVSLWANLRLAPRLAALRAAGEPTSISELAPEAVPAEEDGATYLAEIAPLIEALAKDQGRFYNTPLGQSYDMKSTYGLDLSSEEIVAIRAILEKYPTIEPALREATECKYYASKLDYSLEFNPFLEAVIDRNQDLRTCARMLRWKSEVLLAEGNVEEAIQTGLLVMRLSRLKEQEPALVNGLVANAIRYYGVEIINRALRSGPIDAELRSSLDKQLASYDELDWFVRTMKSERAFNLSGAEDLFPHFPVTWQGTLFKADTIDFYEKVLPFLAEPFYVSAKKLVAYQDDVYSTPVSNSLIGLLFPGLEAAHVSANSNLALVRCLRILNALQRYQETHGEEAAQLADLDIEKSATIDPFSGKLLKVRLTEDGWVIYSVMKNGVDDGGDFQKQLDWGLAPVGYLGSN
jgi:hypothetical protein